MPQFPTYKTYTTLWATICCVRYTSLHFCRVDTNNCSIDLYNGVFTQDWLNSYYSSSSALSCFFIILCKHNPDERSWTKLFVFSLSRVLVYFVHVACCCVPLVIYLLFSNWCCCWFTYNKFDVCVSVAFVYRFNVKRYYTVFIFVTVFVRRFSCSQCFRKKYTSWSIRAPIRLRLIMVLKEFWVVTALRRY